MTTDRNPQSQTLARSAPHTRAALLLGALTATAAMLLPPPAAAGMCEGFGPQTPRDISQTAGSNSINYGPAPDIAEMNLCNIHLHENAEHRGPGFNIYAGRGDADGIGGGYECGIAQSLTAAELSPPKVNHCSGLQTGDTVEVHWVFSSCDIEPGAGLGACSSAACANPTLRVEAQVFTLVNDPNALSFDDLRYAGPDASGRHQPKALPTNTGEPVEFFGSTTGPKYDASTQCSPLQVHWSVRPQCAKLDINSLSAWCESNVFEESAPHGVRALVTHPALLSPIQ